MRNRKFIDKQKLQKRERKAGNSSMRGLLSMTVCALTVVSIAGISHLSGAEKQNEVYAASEKTAYKSADYDLPTGIAGVATGISTTPSEGSKIYRIGTSCDHVVVGQRVQEVESSARDMDVSESMEAAVDTFDSKMASMSSSATMMSDTDYENLLQIVEAEAGTEDIKGRVLIANVIMNRVKYPEFPDNVSEVIWEYDNGVAQFSPVSDGRISEVTVSDETREAVKQALEGVDYSEGALFFIQKSAAEDHNVDWFEKNLKKLFKHGVHEFYTYPTAEEKAELEKKAAEKEAKEAKAKKADNKTDKKDDGQLVQMVRTVKSE